MPTLPTNIRKARLDRGQTQIRVARAAGCSPRTYQRWESGESTPNLATLRHLAVVLGVTVSSLIEEV